MFILTPLINRLLRKPIGRLLNKHGHDLKGKKIEPRLEKEFGANGAAVSMPRIGDVFEGQLNDLSQYDSKGWRRRDISFIKNEITIGQKFEYPTRHGRITLIDSDGARYKLNFSEPENDDRVCLGTPSKLKPWYKKKGFDYRSVNSEDKIYFEYTGQGVVFYIFTEDEYRLKKERQ
jgi:hypothetical protein